MQGKGTAYYQNGQWYVFTPNGKHLLVTSGQPSFYRPEFWCFYETKDNIHMQRLLTVNKKGGDLKS